MIRKSSPHEEVTKLLSFSSFFGNKAIIIKKYSPPACPIPGYLTQTPVEPCQKDGTYILAKPHAL
jgi:hypothetical protein